MISSPQAKKVHELQQFERFAASCGCVPAGDRAQPNPPEPDIVVRESIGVELTELHPAPYGALRRGLESEQLLCTERARAAYIQRAHRPVHVWISWESGTRLQQRKVLCEGIVSLVARNPPHGAMPIDIGTGFQRIEPDLPIVAMSIAPARSHEDSTWRDGDAHEVGFLTPETLQKRITHEDAKVDRYRGSYIARWLILLTRAAGPSTWGDPTDDVASSVFRSRFDCVFVFDDVHERTYPLRITNADLQF